MSASNYLQQQCVLNGLVSAHAMKKPCSETGYRKSASMLLRVDVARTGSRAAIKNSAVALRMHAKLQMHVCRTLLNTRINICKISIE